MIRFQGAAVTASASLYMTKLCKHFRHKIAVEFDERSADARFPFGRCLMQADADSLRFDMTIGVAAPYCRGFRTAYRIFDWVSGMGL